MEIIFMLNHLGLHDVPSAFAATSVLLEGSTSLETAERTPQYLPWADSGLRTGLSASIFQGDKNPPGMARMEILNLSPGVQCNANRTSLR